MAQKRKWVALAEECHRLDIRSPLIQHVLENLWKPRNLLEDKPLAPQPLSLQLSDSRVTIEIATTWYRDAVRLEYVKDGHKLDYYIPVVRRPIKNYPTGSGRAPVHEFQFLCQGTENPLQTYQEVPRYPLLTPYEVPENPRCEYYRSQKRLSRVLYLPPQGLIFACKRCYPLGMLHEKYKGWSDAEVIINMFKI